MAVMIPTTITSFATEGEKELFYLLKECLPNDYIVWYELDNQDRFPDFVILGPEIGLLILEVKDWTTENIISFDQEYFYLKLNSKEHKRKNPKKQGAKYRQDISSKISRALNTSSLYKEITVNNAVCFPNINSQEYRELKDVDGKFATETLDSKLILFKDDLEDIKKNKSIIVEKLRYLLTYLPNNRINEKFNNQIRGILDNRIILKDSKCEIIKQLEAEQEAIVKLYPEGHTLIRGNAGSGKSVMLYKRAQYLADRFPDSNILFLCFNKALASFYNNGPFHRHNKISVQHYHGFKSTKSNEKYDFIFVDEGQDFAVEWYKNLINYLSDNSISHLCVASDGAQLIYDDGRNFSFDQLGINFPYIYELRDNYRNTEEICTFAEAFLLSDEEIYNSTQKSINDNHYVSTTFRKRRNGKIPVLYKLKNREEEYEYISEQIKELNDKGIRYSQIGILFFRNEDIEVFKKQVEDIPVWNINKYRAICDHNVDNVQLAVVNSGKGLEFDYVFLCGFYPGQIPSVIEKKRTYVGMTRAVHELTIVYSDENTSSITEIIEDIYNNYLDTLNRDEIIQKYNLKVEEEKKIIEEFHSLEKSLEESKQENIELYDVISELQRQIIEKEKVYDYILNLRNEIAEKEVELKNEEEALKYLKESLLEFQQEIEVKQQNILQTEQQLKDWESYLKNKEKTIQFNVREDKSIIIKNRRSNKLIKRVFHAALLIILVTTIFIGKDLFMGAIMGQLPTIKADKLEEEQILAFSMVPLRNIRTTYGTIKDGNEFIGFDSLEMKGYFRNGFEILLTKRADDYFLSLSGEFKGSSSKPYIQVNHITKLKGPIIEFIFHNEAVLIDIDGTLVNINEKVHYQEKKFIVKFNTEEETFENQWIE